MKKKETILVIGAGGQIGTELILSLRSIYGSSNVIAADIKTPGYEVFEGGPYEILDVLDNKRLSEIVKKHSPSQIYLLAALLSSTAEQNPAFGWKLNMVGLFNVLEIANKKKIPKVFWPSSIAVFGPNTPKVGTPQYTITEPSTVYGISKLAGERWCEYYFHKHQMDIRSIRYPGLIGYKSQPGGGTTDYAVHIFHEALIKKSYKCFLSENTSLPMMYMPDAIRGTIELMETKAEKISVRSSYNFSAISFSPKDIALEIKRHIKGFTISYQPDHRQKYAESWPRSIDDTCARNDWNWKPEFDLSRMTADMIKNMKKS